MNSETHSCIHSFASFETYTCSQENIRGIINLKAVIFCSLSLSLVCSSSLSSQCCLLEQTGPKFEMQKLEHVE